MPETSPPTSEGEGRLVSASQEGMTPAEPVVERPSARQRSSRFVKGQERCESHDQRVLALLRQEKERERASQRTRQRFQRMKNTLGDEASAWIRVCSPSGIAEREAFALGIQKERPAVVTACALASHNGMAEGLVNTRKQRKGSRDGRGSIAF